MAAVLRLTLRGLRVRAWRLSLTAVAVMLGVAFMVGARVFTDTMVTSLDEVLESSTAGVDFYVQRAPAVEGLDDPVTSLPDLAVDMTRSVPGVQYAEGSIQGFAQLVNPDGDVVRAQGPGFALVTNWIETPTLNPFRLVEGAAPRSPDDVVIDRDSARRAGYRVGDTAFVLANGVQHAFTVSGLATLDASVSFSGAALIATTLETAQASFGEIDHVTRVLVAVTPGADVEPVGRAVVRALRTLVPETEFESADELTAERKERLDATFEPFVNLLTTFVFISIFVGAFLIANTFAILLSQRTHEIALLRTLGARRSQLLLGLVLEATIFGLVAAAIGLGLGIAAAVGLIALLERSGLPLPDGPLRVTTTTIVVAFVVGVAVTIGASASPVVRAARTRPIAALRSTEAEAVRVPWIRVVLGVVGIAVGTLVFLRGAAVGIDGFGLIGLGALVVIVGIVLAAPGAVRHITPVIGAPLRFFGPPGLLAIGNTRRNPRRTASTMCAVMIGAALVTFVTILAASVKASVDATVDRAFRADFIVDGQTRANNGFSPEFVTGLRDRPEFDAVSGLRVTEVRTPDGRTRDLHGVDTNVVDQLIDFVSIGETMQPVVPGSVAVQVDEAARLGVDVGDVIPITFATGTTLELRVAVLFLEPLPPRDDATYVVHTDTFVAGVGATDDIDVFVGLAPGVSPTVARALLDDLTAELPQASVRDRADLKARVTERVDQILNLLYALLALAVVIAALGIANTLALAVHERVREIGLLRAVGMTRHQVRASVRWEALVVSVSGTALGIVLAILASRGVVDALADGQTITFAVPAAPTLVIVAAAIVAGVLAAIGPARRAARLDVLRAIALE